MCACVVEMYQNKALMSCDDEDANLAVGAYGILNRTTMFFVMIVFGVTQGMQPILGYNMGAGQWDRVKRTLKMGVWIGVAITSIGWVITEVFPDLVTSMFTTDEKLMEIARTGSRLYFMVYPVVGAQIVIQNYFQSIGKPVMSIFLSLTRQLLFLLPFLWVLPRLLGVDGVWLSMSGSDMLAFITACVTIWVSERRGDRRYAIKANEEKFEDK